MLPLDDAFVHDPDKSEAYPVASHACGLLGNAARVCDSTENVVIRPVPHAAGITAWHAVMLFVLPQMWNVLSSVANGTDVSVAFVSPCPQIALTGVPTLLVAVEMVAFVRLIKAASH